MSQEQKSVFDRLDVQEFINSLDDVKRDEQWFNNYSWGQHLEKGDTHEHSQD